MRTEKELTTAKLIERTEDNLCGEGCSAVGDYVMRNLKLQRKMEAVAKEYIDNKTDEELFEIKEDINSDILNSEAYRIRSEEYTLNYFHQYLESKTPQELILSF